MAIEMVRIPSETPNIANIDDFVGLRYAYGNQDGYVANKGNECSYSINGNIFKINSGRLVLQGVECDIDANGVEITVESISATRYFTIYLQVNLALNETKILSQYDTATYPVIESGDDLTQITNGVARLPLYHFIATNGVISGVEKIVVGIDFYGDSPALEIERDLNGVLKIGDTIIPQKKLISEGGVIPVSYDVVTFTFSEQLNIGDTIEIYYYTPSDDIYAEISAKCYKCKVYGEKTTITPIIYSNETPTTLGSSFSAFTCDYFGFVINISLDKMSVVNQGGISYSFSKKNNSWAIDQDVNRIDRNIIISKVYKVIE